MFLIKTPIRQSILNNKYTGSLNNFQQQEQLAKMSQPKICFEISFCQAHAKYIFIITQTFGLSQKKICSIYLFLTL